MDKLAQIIGLISAALTTLAFLPQVIRTWRTRSTADLSPLMFALFFIGITGWLIYGLMKEDVPLILANIVTLCLSGIILFYIIRGDKAVTIAHTGIFVDDLEMMRHFYCNHFNGNSGPKYHNTQSGFSSYFVDFSGRTRLELMHMKGTDVSRSKQVHIAFSLGSARAVDDLTEKFRSMGLIILGEPRLTGDGFYESKILDPEGNHLELTV